MTGDWVKPWDPEEPLDVEACTRKLEFSVGWFADPIYFGRYPHSMVKQLGSRLPTFTTDEAAVLRGSNDFYGMNHYTANYIKHKTGPVKPLDFSGHLEILMEDRFGNSIGPKTQSFWLRPHPAGFRKMFNWLNGRYGGPRFLVTENGTSVLGENDLPAEKLLQDDFRVRYFRDYIAQMVDARCEDGVEVVGYMAWSLLEYVLPLLLLIDMMFHANECLKRTATLNGRRDTSAGSASRMSTTPTTSSGIRRSRRG
jgi:beta-glucosidase